MKIAVFLFVSSCLLPSLSTAQVTKTWDGDAGTHYWHTDVNWDPAGVPSATDIVEIENDSVNIELDVTVRQLYLVNAQLHIGAGSVVSIDDASSNYDNACELSSESTLYNHGVLSINEAVAEGIHISSGCSLFNHQGAEIIINNSGTFYAIWNGGNFLNRGNLLISHPPAHGIYNGNSLINQKKGHIEIIDATIGMDNQNVCSNYGTIQICNSLSFGFGISNLGIAAQFNNYGTIAIDSIDGDALTLLQAGTMTNHSGGLIYIDVLLDTLFGTGINIIDDAHLINRGLIKIDDTAFGMLASGHVSNSDSLLITNIDRLGLQIRQDSFINESTGLIVIKDCDETLQVDSSATFQCNGLLDIRN